MKRTALSRPWSDLGQLRRTRWRSFVLRAIGAGFLAATGAIHLDLYVTGYRTIPTIGWLFLVQIIAAFALSVTVLTFRSRLVSGAGAGCAIATLGGYLLSLRVGLFGFREVRTSAGILAGVIEVAAFAVLAWSALSPDGPRRVGARGTERTTWLARVHSALPVARWATVGLSAVAALLLALCLAAAGPASTGTGTSRALLKLGDVSGVSVLTNARGYTLYLFVPDPPGKSTCYGTCAAYWPPVTGTPTAGTGVTGKLGTIRRSDGGNQVTYNGHPLYTYVGDSAPGQANGNNINLNEGLWREIVVPG
jgi:predicted lipoprotein with Yx(FWY)xxD motif